MQWKYDLFTKLPQLSRLKAPKTDYYNFMPPFDQVLQGGYVPKKGQSGSTDYPASLQDRMPERL